MSLTSSPKLIKGGLVVLDAGRRRGAQHDRAAVQPRHADAQLPGAGRRRRRRRRARAAVPPQGAGDRDDQARGRDRRHRPARASRQQRQRGGLRHRARSSRVLEALVNPTRRGAARAWRRKRRTGRSRSCRPRRRWCCSSGARAASCRCASPSSRSPRRPSIPSLNPIRAKVSLGLRVLSTDDLGFTHKGGTHVPQLPAHARGAGRQGAASASLASLGLTSLP